jgi:type I restriction enzyme, S subunit
MLPEGWRVHEIGTVLEKVSVPVQVEPETQYVQIGIRSHGKGIFIKDAVSGRELGEKRVFWVQPNALVLNIVFAWEQAVARTGEQHKGKIASHRFPMYRPRENRADVDFLNYYFKTERGKYLLELASPGGAGRNKTLGQAAFERLELSLPPLSEQKKIADILSTWDAAFETTGKLLANAEAQKRALMQQLLTGKRRLKGFEGREWKLTSVGAMGKIVGGGTPDSENEAAWNGTFNWATPTDITRLDRRYIGTTDRKLTEKGLSESAAKLLPSGSLLVCTRATIGEMAIATAPISTNQGFKNIIPNSKFNVEFLYHLLSFFKHKLIRYACGSTFLELSKKDFEKLTFIMPELDEQLRIADLINTFEDEIETYRRVQSHLQSEKRALMQQLLTGKRRVSV